MLKVKAAPASLLVLSVFGAATCDAQRLQSPAVFTATTINGRALPFTDSAQVRGVLEPVQQIRAWRLTLTPQDHGEITSTFKDVAMTHFPCEVQRSMRDALMGTDSGGNAITAIKDTATTGCDDLSVITLTAPVQYHRTGDSLVVTREGRGLFAGTWRGDTLTMLSLDGSAKKLVAIRRH